MLANWVAETSTTTGAADVIALSAAQPGCVRFGAVLANNEPVPYHLVTGNGDRESGVAVYSNNTLTRVVISEQMISGVAIVAPTVRLTLVGTTVVMLGNQVATSYVPQPPTILHGPALAYVSPANYSSTTSGTAIPANEVTWAPYLITSVTRIDQIRLTVTAAGSAGSIARIALDTYAQPGALSTRLYESANIDIASTGTKVETIPPLTLRPGWYWVGYIGSAAHSVRCYNNPMISPLCPDGNGVNVSSANETVAGWSAMPPRNIIDYQRRYYAPGVHFRVAV